MRRPSADGPGTRVRGTRRAHEYATFRVMDVEDVSLDLPSQFPAVTLVESEPPMRTLVFPVGLPEGTAIAQALRRMEGRRPMTHELFVQVHPAGPDRRHRPAGGGPRGGDAPGRARPDDARRA